VFRKLNFPYPYEKTFETQKLPLAMASRNILLQKAQKGVKTGGK
jgi:hypothetical protein